MSARKTSPSGPISSTFVASSAHLRSGGPGPSRPGPPPPPTQAHARRSSKSIRAGSPGSLGDGTPEVYLLRAWCFPTDRGSVTPSRLAPPRPTVEVLHLRGWRLPTDRGGVTPSRLPVAEGPVGVEVLAQNTPEWYSAPVDPCRAGRAPLTRTAMRRDSMGRVGASTARRTSPIASPCARTAPSVGLQEYARKRGKYVDNTDPCPGHISAWCLSPCGHLEPGLAHAQVSGMKPRTRAWRNLALVPAPA